MGYNAIADKSFKFTIRIVNFNDNEFKSIII